MMQHLCMHVLSISTSELGSEIVIIIQYVLTVGARSKWKILQAVSSLCSCRSIIESAVTSGPCTDTDCHDYSQSFSGCTGTFPYQLE